jgi:GT2 family glycosyltransferase
MAVYNGEPYVATAVESVLAQTFRDFEFIIVNDASTDGTHTTLSAFAARDARLVLIDNDANRGVAGSLNRGLQLARGKYVARQDADDLSEPQRLAEQVAVLGGRPVVGLLGTWVDLMDAAGRPIDEHPYPDITGDSALQAALLKANCFCHGSVMFRRALLDGVGDYDEHLEGAEDYDLWLRLAEVTQLEKVPQTLYRYRHHTASVSETHRAFQVWQQARTLEKMAARRFGPSLPLVYARLVAGSFLQAAEISFQRGDTAAYQERLAHAIQSCPAFFAEPDTFVPLPPLPAGLAMLDQVFSRLPARPVYQRLLRRLRAREHMRAVFAQARRGQPANLQGDLWPAVRQDPAWLLNRGVLSLTARSLLARPRRRGPTPAAPSIGKDKSS